ncbi:histidine triad (HIT) family protein [Spirosoma oryzae]|uniref:Histidine triad (HIT) family protein n=1 Tax=Spirosoma oryzae TaxID=1469603 RepID=A0A2T0TB44_9BACT|nr:HIT family protein [Spirosoma oryzae]PRY42887.1 histidine triad (HIT) family protein [Spirosoma oryzae]
MPSIFSRIVAGEIPAHKIAETDAFLAFLDVMPTTTGHTLVIPKQEVDYIFDLDDATYTDLMLFAKRVASAVEKAIPCQRIGVAVVGLEVPHAHVHLIPLNSMADMDFSQKLEPRPTAEELAATAEKIREQLL